MDYKCPNNGNIATHNSQQEIYSFDPWGRRRNPTDWTFTAVPTEDNYLIDRGFTGHEHLDLFGLVNMNARMYDPLLGRMLSPDNYVQAPGSSQGYNRYSYAMNNPLVFTDPSGEFVGIMYFGGVVGIGYLSNLLNGYSDPLGNAYNDAEIFVDEFSNCARYPIYQDENTYVSAGIDVFNAGISIDDYHKEDDFTFYAGTGVDMAERAWGNASVTYTTGDWSFTAGGGFSYGGTNVFTGNSTPGGGRSYFGITYYDDIHNLGFSAGITHFGGAHSQYNLYVGGWIGDFSATTTNDFLFSDKYRTAALEFGIGDFSGGFNLYTTSPPEKEYKSDPQMGGDENWISPIHGKPEHGTYSSGERIYAALYIGMRIGKNVSRIGVDAPWAQDGIQNFAHKKLGYPFFNTDKGPPSRMFMQSGNYFPYSLYLY